MSEVRERNTPKITLTVDTSGIRESTTSLIVNPASKKIDGTREAATSLAVDHISKRVDAARESPTNLAVDRVSERVDAIHDAVGKGGAVIAAAKNAMSTVSGVDLLKLTPRECLVPLKRVIDGLQAVKCVHPFIGVIATAFEAILTLEMKRRDNDRRVVGLLLKQADMLATLFQLDTITAAAIQQRGNDLPALLNDIKKDIAECGNVIDTFSKQKFLGKFLRAIKWEEKLIHFVDLFERRKGEIQGKLQIKVTSVATNVESIDMKVDMILTLFKHQTEQEKKAAVEVEKLGGSQRCIENDAYLAELERKLYVTDSKESLKLASTNKRQLKTSTSLLISLRSEVDTLIDKNKTYFDVKLDALTKQLENAIHRSTRKIIAAFGSGPWSRVSDPDIRHRASSSVKARVFVLALHDYYVDRLSDPPPVDYMVKRTTSNTELNIEDNSSLSPSLFGSDTHTEYSTTIESLEEDQWCLSFLSVGRAPAIAEAIDDDVSGFIKIAEVNDFYHEKPPEFSMLRWITFWAAGWGVEVTMYHHRIERLIENLLDIMVLPENGHSYVEYQNTLRWIMCLLRSRSPETTEEPELLHLIRQHMSHQEATMTAALKPAKWEIDSADTVSTLLGPGRIEKYLYPLLYLTLRRHYQVFKLASKIALHVMEFESATETIQSILSACVLRTRTLVEAFEQQLVGSPDAHLKRFAGGLFANWYHFNPWISKDPQTNHSDSYTRFPLEINNIDTEEPIPEIELESLHYGVMKSLEEAGCQRQPINFLKNDEVQSFPAVTQWDLMQGVHGEPFTLTKPTDISTETSDQQRIRMLETAVAQHEEAIRIQVETLRRQEEVMKGQEEAMRIQAETMRSMNYNFDRLMTFLDRTYA
ncbi:hypothetical protein BU17DRAFT_91087 [Hysterangium stoloniferum]|nr:hypothetical protein BU17DRAFT_91087 [Hysterangium stoloniferum]